MKSLLAKSLSGFILFVSAGMLHAADGKTSAHSSLPKWPDPVGEKCVAPTDEMRREHMNMILHQRDVTMRQGIRGSKAKYALKDCIDCHAAYDEQNKPIPINAEGQFCESCHTYTAVSIDCFSCHRTTPAEDNPRRPEMKAKPDIASKVEPKVEQMTKVEQMKVVGVSAGTVSGKGVENE